MTTMLRASPAAAAAHWSPNGGPNPATPTRVERLKLINEENAIISATQFVATAPGESATIVWLSHWWLWLMEDKLMVSSFSQRQQIYMQDFPAARKYISSLLAQLEPAATMSNLAECGVTTITAAATTTTTATTTAMMTTTTANATISKWIKSATRSIDRRRR